MDNGQRAVDGQWPIAVAITLLLVLRHSIGTRFITSIREDQGRVPVYTHGCIVYYCKENLYTYHSWESKG